MKKPWHDVQRKIALAAAMAEKSYLCRRKEYCEGLNEGKKK